MAAPQPTQGLQNARSPGSITNAEHHDATGVKKSTDGMLASFNQKIIANSSVATPVGDYAPMWVVNTDTSLHFIYIGKEDAVPGSPSITTALALPPGFARMVYGPASDDPMKSIVVKTDSATVQVVVMDER